MMKKETQKFFDLDHLRSFIAKVGASKNVYGKQEIDTDVERLGKRESSEPKRN